MKIETTGGSDEEDFDADPYINTKVDDAEAMVRDFSESLKAGKRRVFFNAASGYDLYPIYRFSHLADTFIFADQRSGVCDLTTSASEAWATLIQTIKKKETPVGDKLVYDQPFIAPIAAYQDFATVFGYRGKLIAEMVDEPLAHLPGGGLSLGWGAVIRLKRIVGAQSREIWLVYLAGNPIQAYQNILMRNHIVPEILRFGPRRNIEEAPPEVNQARHNNWVASLSWDGGLGQALRAGQEPLPRLVNDHPILGWPLNPVRYVGAADRHENLSSTGSYEVAGPTPGAPPANLHVTLTRKPLSPSTAQQFGAIVLPEELFAYFRRGRDRWPQHTHFILTDLAPEFIPEFAGLNVSVLDMRGRPLLQNLEAVEAICLQRGIDSVAINGLPGFEDEAHDLLRWRQQDGPIKRLTLHLNCNGHMADYACAADVID